MEVVGRSISEHYKWGEGCDGWHLVKSEKLSVIQEIVPPGKFEELHAHKHAEQFFFVLSGTATMDLAGKIFEVRSNQGIHVPAGVMHQLRNESDETLEFIVTSTPPSHGDRVLEI